MINNGHPLIIEQHFLYFSYKFWQIIDIQISFFRPLWPLKAKQAILKILVILKLFHILYL